MSKININGTELEFDVAEKSDAEAYDRAIKNYQAKLSELKELNGVEVLSKGIEMVKDFFYDATGKDILADVTNLRIAMKHYNTFLEYVSGQVAEINSMFKEETSELSPVTVGGKRPDKR